MATIEAFETYLEKFAPLRLAEPWDNVGFLVGDRRMEVRRLMTCLTVTPTTVDEAIHDHADLIVTHHPLPFSAVKKLTSDSIAGRMLLTLIAAGVAVYSPHTAFDSAAEGINQRLAERLGLMEIAPLVPHPEGQGSGRWGKVDGSPALGDLARRFMKSMGIGNLQIVGDLHQKIRTVAVACGAADEFLEVARKTGSDVLVLGEARFHTCLEAEAWGIGLLLPGHFASERFAVEELAGLLGREFPAVQVWASRKERDPLQRIDARQSPREV